MPGLECVRQTAAALGDDFNAALDQSGLANVDLEGFERDALHLGAGNAAVAAIKASDVMVATEES